MTQNFISTNSTLVIVSISDIKVSDLTHFTSETDHFQKKISDQSNY